MLLLLKGAVEFRLFSFFVCRCFADVAGAWSLGWGSLASPFFLWVCTYWLCACEAVAFALSHGAQLVVLVLRLYKLKAMGRELAHKTVDMTAKSRKSKSG